MARSMQHWNGNQVCAIDTETTGLDPLYDEILQIAILPLDSDFELRKDILPFNITMKPEYPDRIKAEAMQVNKLDLDTIMATGFDKETGIQLLEEWYKKLGLPCTKYGRPKKVIPLGQNYAFDKGFIQQWLGIDLYNDLFDYHYVDTMIAANYMNDRAAFHAETVPFSKVNLQYLASTLKIKTDRLHDALQDAYTCARVYKAMMKLGPLLI